MDLLNRVLNYSNDTKIIRDNKTVEINRVNNKYNNDIKNLDDKKNKLNKEILDINNKIKICKSNIKSRLDYDYRRLMYNSLSEYISIFDIEEKLFSKDKDFERNYK